MADLFSTWDGIALLVIAALVLGLVGRFGARCA